MTVRLLLALSLCSLTLSPTGATQAPSRPVAAADSATSVSYPAKPGAGQGKHIVFLAGDEEYRSEEGLPMLAKILSQRHGFKCTVLFSVDPDGTINPKNGTSLSNAAALDSADAIVMLLRFRAWPDEDMARFDTLLKAGTPIVALRTSTHAFNGFPKGSAWETWNYNNQGGFGKRVLGETWVTHWGKHKVEATRGAIEPQERKNPLLRGITSLFGDTDVYEAYPPADATILVRGIVLQTLAPDSAPADYRKARATDKQQQGINDPAMPVVWTRLNKNDNGTTNKILTTTMGSATDLENEGVRRLVVNGVYWGLGMNVPDKAEVTYVDEYLPSFYGFDGFRRGLRASDFELGKKVPGQPLPRAGSTQAAPDAHVVATFPRIIVSTDIGGTDPDDFQSLVHFLLYADMFDIEGLISSPYGPGRRAHILQVIDRYATDYPNLKTYSDRYPTPDALRRVTKQGAIESAAGRGVGQSTEGSDWIVRAARRNDPRPLWVLVWGGIDDVAQALHDAPDILPKLRVYFIGGPNKMWSVDAYDYLEQHHPKLWIIEANATYRGWFTGGNQTGEWSNRAFGAAHVAGRGALGTFFATLLDGTLKMGDSPSVGYLLHGTPDDPSQPGWGGKFVRIWDGRKTIFDRLTTAADTAEVFGVVELALPIPAGVTRDASARMVFDGRIPAVATNDGRTLRFRFSPRDAKVWPYVIRSEAPGLDGQSGSFTAVPPPAERSSRPSPVHPNWWIDDPDPAAAEGVHPGAKSVNIWREPFLRDFAARMLRCAGPR